MWTIYDHPRDYPHCFVARQLDVRGWPDGMRTTDLIQSDSLEKLRERFRQEGLIPIPRHPSDDAVIVESWI